MTSYIGAPPANYVIPVTRGADREFTANRVDTSGGPVDWPDTVFLAIDIDKSNPTLITATVTLNQAVLLIPAAVCDQVKPLTRWRLYMETGSGPTALTTPVAVGYFERDDGGKPTQ